MILICIFGCILMSVAASGDMKDTYKDQYCTDPRTMRKHAAYTEWADAYSCSRHRCQPGGRNLAIYTVGCKRVEAPESAIECEEVVEDTNMQFPFCCTRLRCLVVVRGEVWTRVLGQPWETLPAAPWSHMYKMKKPPPTDTTFLPKTGGDQGPVYELVEPDSEGARDKVLRAAKKTTTDSTDCNEVVPRAAPPPDIVIALSTNTDQQQEHKKGEGVRHKRMRKNPVNSPYFEEVEHREPEPNDMDDTLSISTEKPAELSDERYYANTFAVTQKVPFQSQQHHQVSWTEIPQNQWNEHDPSMDAESRDGGIQQPQDFQAAESEKRDDRPSNLQALVDAIGTRMRDIENVVQRMSEKVHKAKPIDVSNEKRIAEAEVAPPRKHHKTDKEPKEFGKAKRPNADGEHYKRFSVRNRGSKYLHGTTEVTTDQPLFVEDTNMNGYFSDASNSVVRRAGPKEPAASGVPIYMAPIDTRRSSAHKVVSDISDDDKKRKKHSHKKKKGKGRGHKKRRGKEEKMKHFSRVSSLEIDKNVVSLEDSSAVGSK